ncbi:hypothetical protein [Pseudomonas synxantha]|nr:MULTISPECIES: hypothetical protein [Pseudomonas fluorescens group]
MDDAHGKQTEESAIINCTGAATVQFRKSEGDGAIALKPNLDANLTVNDLPLRTSISMVGGSNTVRVASTLSARGGLTAGPFNGATTLIMDIL